MTKWDDFDKGKQDQQGQGETFLIHRLLRIYLKQITFNTNQR
jgi:hypothetical protein